MRIQFISQLTEFQLYKPKKYREFLTACAREEGKRINNLLYKFVSEQKILSINSQFLNHNYVTDIITFDNSFLEDINGEIFICVEEVRRNALLHNSNSFEEELNRVILHGLLHLLGYKDGSESDRKIMRNKESYYLQYFV